MVAVRQRSHRRRRRPAHPGRRPRRRPHRRDDLPGGGTAARFGYAARLARGTIPTTMTSSYLRGPSRSRSPARSSGAAPTARSRVRNGDGPGALSRRRTACCCRPDPAPVHAGSLVRPSAVVVVSVAAAGGRAAAPESIRSSSPWHEADAASRASPPTGSPAPPTPPSGTRARAIWSPAPPASAQRADPPRQPAGVPHRALRGRGGTPPRRRRPPPALWDDYDRFRKVPFGVDEAWNEHIGRPLSAVPDPWGCHASGPSTSKPLRDALVEMGCEMYEVNQTEMYTAGAYREQILRWSAGVHEIDEVLGRYRTKAPRPRTPRRRLPCRTRWPSTTRAREPTTSSGSRSSPTAAAATATRPPSPATTTRRPTCPTPATGAAYSDVTNLATQNEGKLVWKVDWPMRWAFEKVDFEPAGADHSSPGSSFTVGHELVEKIWGWPRPSWFGYSFVGFAGMARCPPPRAASRPAQDALAILEAPILRWLYVRRQPRQSFNIDFGPEVIRLYDEWDALARKATDPERRTPKCWPSSGPVHLDGRRAAHPAGRRTVPGAAVGRRHYRGDRSDQPDHRRSRLPARVRRGTRAAAVDGDELDRGLRPRRGPHPRSRRSPTPSGWAC